jgi:hypothetical protein
MVRLYGRAPVAKVALRPLEDANARAELRVDGVTAPYVIDGAMDGPAFLAYVEQMLAA